MKKLKFLLLLGLPLLVGEVRGQDYIPLALEDAQWIIQRMDDTGFPDGFHGYFIEGDTVINNLNYKKVYLREFAMAYNPPLTITNEYIYGAVRDDIDNRKVHATFLINFGGTCPSVNEDFLLYNFALQIGDTVENSICDQFPYFIVTEKFESNIYNKVRNTIEYHDFYNFCYSYAFEGIGSENGLFDGIGCFENGSQLYRYCIGKDCIGDLLVTSIRNKIIPEIKIHPNPIDDFFSVIVDSKFFAINIKVKLFDISGNLLSEEFLSDSKTRINTSKLPKGVYFVTVYAENHIIQTQKVVKL